MSDPIDDTQPHPTVGGGVPPAAPADPSESAAPPAAGADSPTGGPASAPPAAADPPLQAAPPGPPSDWREPAWYPPKERSRDRGPGTIAIVIGLGLLAVGLYYFLDQTLGVDLPPIRWSSLWPVILIVIGGLIVLRAMSRRS